MSSADCANCDCPDKTNCPKKQGFQLQEEVAQNPRHAILMGFVNNHRESGGVENECKCGPAVNPFYYY